MRRGDIITTLISKRAIKRRVGHPGITRLVKKGSRLRVEAVTPDGIVVRYGGPGTLTYLRAEVEMYTGPRLS